MTDVDDIEIKDWCVTNTHAHLWYCADVSESPLLKIAIENALKKTPNADLSGSLFDKIHDIQEHQLVGFVSSDTTKSNVLNSFHLHSFVTFYTEMQKKTVITCVLTTGHHIHSNMQDQSMQLVQLVQYGKIEYFSMFLSNKVMNVSITPNDLRAYQSLVFNTSSFNKEDEFFSVDINTPISMVWYRDSHTWGKYRQHFMELDFYGKGQFNNNLHGSFRSSMINFLETNIAGTATNSMNPYILSQLQQFLLAYSTSGLDKKQISSMWDQEKETVVQQLSNFLTSATVIPFSIFTEMMCQHFGKLKFLESTLKLLQQFKL